jgi:hypothetical protein
MKKLILFSIVVLITVSYVNQKRDETVQAILAETYAAYQHRQTTMQLFYSMQPTETVPSAYLTAFPNTNGSTGDVTDPAFPVVGYVEIRGLCCVGGQAGR